MDSNSMWDKIGKVLMLWAALERSGLNEMRDDWYLLRPGAPNGVVCPLMIVDDSGTGPVRMEDIQATRGGDGSLQVKGAPKWVKERGDD